MEEDIAKKYSRFFKKVDIKMLIDIFFLIFVYVFRANITR